MGEKGLHEEQRARDRDEGKLFKKKHIFQSNFLFVINSYLLYYSNK